jgi:ribosomal protein S18 acetylase RimI-like enzyme
MMHGDKDLSTAPVEGPAAVRDWTYVPGAVVAELGGVVIRRFHPNDRSEVRKICADTGYLGGPVDPLFQDRELFADYLTSYFTDHEPESTFIVDQRGQIAGYMMGCRDTRRLRRKEPWQFLRLGLIGGFRLLSGRYNRASRKFVWWVLTKGRKEIPFTPPDTWAHFHVNLLPDARGIAGSRLLFDVFLAYLRDSGAPGVYGQMASYDGRRGLALFERYGFKVLGMRGVSKYRDLRSEPVMLCTIARELAGFAGLEAERARARVSRRVGGDES